MPRKKLDIAYFNKKAYELSDQIHIAGGKISSDKPSDEIMAVLREFAVYMHRQIKRQKLARERIDDSQLCFNEIFWNLDNFHAVGYPYSLKEPILPTYLRDTFYGNFTVEIYAEYKKLFQEADKKAT